MGMGHADDVVLHRHDDGMRIRRANFVLDHHRPPAPSGRLQCRLAAISAGGSETTYGLEKRSGRSHAQLVVCRESPDLAALAAAGAAWIFVLTCVGCRAASVGERGEVRLGLSALLLADDIDKLFFPFGAWESCDADRFGNGSVAVFRRVHGGTESDG
jgi:hypothetical protein